MDYRHVVDRKMTRFAAGLAVAVLVITGCGASVSQSTSKSPTSTSTTDRAAGTTTLPKDARSLTVDDLEKLLPTAAEVGPDYRIDTSSDDSDESDADDADDDMDNAMKQACPDAYKLMNDDDDDDDGPSASRSFTTDDSRTFEVDLEPDASDTAGFDSEAELDRVVDALNGCDTISYTDKDGIHLEMTLKAKKDGTYGDMGVVMDMDMELSGDTLPKVIPMQSRMRMFLLGDVGVTVTATSGIDDDTLDTVPADMAMIDTLSGSIEKGVAKLLREA